MAAFWSGYSAPTRDEAEGLFTANYGRVALSGDITVSDEMVIADRFILDQIKITGRARVRAETPMFVLIASAAGHYRWDVDDERGDAASVPFLVRPGTITDVEMVEPETHNVLFDADAFAATARAMYGDDKLDLTFDRAGLISPEAGELVRASIAYGMSLRAEVVESDKIAASLYRYLAAIVLEGSTLRGDTDARRASARALREGYQRAARFIDDFASLPITLDDVAEAAGLTSRQLIAAFRSQSPTEEHPEQRLRRTRRDAAERDLAAREITGDSIRDIALRWGLVPPRGSRRPGRPDSDAAPGCG